MVLDARVEEYSTALSNLQTKFLDWYKLYRLFQNEQPLPGQSNIFIPKIFEIIEKKAPAMVVHEPKLIVYARDNEIIQYTKDIRNIIDFWWRQNGMQAKLEPWVKESMIYGFSIVMGGWKVERRKEINEVIDADEDGNEIIREEEVWVTIREYPTAEIISPFNILFDPTVESVQDGDAIIRLIPDVRIYDILMDEDAYDLSDVPEEYLKGITDASNTTVEGIVPELTDVDVVRGIVDTSGKEPAGKCSLVEMWGIFSPTGDPADEEEYVITKMCFGSSGYIIRCQPTGLARRPVVKLDNRKVFGEFCSIGEVEPLEGLQIEYNNTRNARIDFNNAVNYPEWIINTNAGINPEHLIHKPNNIIPVDGDINNAIRALEKPVAPISSINEEGQMNRDFQTISQTLDYTDRGGANGFDSTATGINSRDNERSLLLNNGIRHLERAIAEVGEMWLMLAEKMVDDSISISVNRTEEDMAADSVPLEVAPQKMSVIDAEIFDDILNKASLVVEGGSTTAYSAIGKSQDAIGIGNLVAQFIALGVPIDVQKVFKDILRDSYQKENPESYIMAQQPQQGVPPQMGAGGAMDSAPNAAGGGATKAAFQPTLAQN